MTWLALVAVVLTAAATGVSVHWWARGRRTLAVAHGLGLAVGTAAVAATLLADQAPALGAAPWHRWVVIAVTGTAAVLAGGAIAVGVLFVADRSGDTPVRPNAVGDQTLRGGAWIGVLERLASFAAITAGYPEAVALILAIKGLARYPELRAHNQTGIAERFIIGTFTSMATAAGCAGLAHLLLT